MEHKSRENIFIGIILHLACAIWPALAEDAGYRSLKLGMNSSEILSELANMGHRNPIVRRSSDGSLYIAANEYQNTGNFHTDSPCRESFFCEMIVIGFSAGSRATHIHGAIVYAENNNPRFSEILSASLQKYGKIVNQRNDGSRGFRGDGRIRGNSSYIPLYFDVLRQEGTHYEQRDEVFLQISIDPATVSRDWRFWRWTSQPTLPTPYDAKIRRVLFEMRRHPAPWEQPAPLPPRVQF